MKTSIRAFLVEEDGITALEYGLLAALMATIIVVTFKTQLASIFQSIFTAISGSVTTATN